MTMGQIWRGIFPLWLFTAGVAATTKLSSLSRWWSSQALGLAPSLTYLGSGGVPHLARGVALT
jgi:hypothetical protein